MARVRQWLAAGLAALLFTTGCTTPAPRATGPVDIQLIAFNDFHGHLQPPGSPLRMPAADGGAPIGLPTGGVAWLAGQIETLRRENPRSVVVAAGDLIGASPLVSSLLKHEPTIAALGEAGLEFSSVGNHEFDGGVPELRRLQRLARFRYLAANLRYRDSGKPVFPAWVRKRIALPGGGHVDMAFVGAVVRDTPSFVAGDAVAGVEFLDEADSVNAAVREIRAAGIEAIVLLIHEGGYTDQKRFDDLTCPGFRGPILGIVERLDPAVDVVVSGHTHLPYVCRHAGKLVTSAGLEGRILTDIDLTVDRAGGDITSARARQLPVIDGSRPNALAAEFPGAPADARLLKRVAGWTEAIAPLANRVVGSLGAPLHDQSTDTGENSLGAMIADAQLAATSGPAGAGAQMAFMNGGGVRADLAPADGQVRYADIFAVHPFGNRLVTLTLTGDEIDTLLETQWQGAGSKLQASAGLQYRWSDGAAAGSKIAPGDILLDGRPLSPAGLYRVTVNSFMADGGDGYAVLKNGRDRVPGVLDVEALERYLGSQSPVSPPPPGRIVKLP